MTRDFVIYTHGDYELQRFSAGTNPAEIIAALVKHTNDEEDEIVTLQVEDARG